MLKKIIINEWRDLYADRMLSLLLLLFVFATVYGIYNGESWARQQAVAEEQLSSIWDQKLAEYKSQLNNNRPATARFGVQLSQNPYLMSAQKIDVALPPAVLAVLSVGQSDLYLNNTQAYLWSDADNLFAKTDLQNPLNLIIGSFDLAFVVVFLFPLIILAFSYNLLSSEKENGTLGLLLSQPVTLRQVLLGKVLARVLVIFPALILTVLLGLLITGNKIGTFEGGGKFLLWCGIVVFYGLFWFALAVLVNSFDYNSPTNATALAGIWLIFVIIVPSLLNTATITLYPIPARSELIVASREAQPDVEKEGEQILAKFYEDNPGLRPTANEAEISDFRRKLLLVFLNDRKEVAPLIEKYDSQLNKRQSLVSKFSLCSPAVITQESLNDIAGTGFVRYQTFREQVNRFVEINRQFYVPKIIKGEKLTASDYDLIPRFYFSEEPVGNLSSRVGFSLAGLIILLFFCLSGIFYKLQRFSIIG